MAACGLDQEWSHHSIKYLIEMNPSALIWTCDGESPIYKIASQCCCGSDVLTGSSLDPNLYSLELWDGVEPFFALNETGRAAEGELSTGDSDCSSDVETIEASFRETYFGDVSNSVSLVGRSYSGKFVSLIS